MERQRQLLGCSEDTSCIAEISAALGVPLIVIGRLTRLADRYEFDVRIVRQADGEVVARDFRSADGEKNIGALMEASAEALAAQVTPQAPPKPFASRLWVPAAVGTAAFVAGALLWGLAEGEYGSLTRPGMLVLTDEQISLKFRALVTQRTAGMIVAGLGAALIAAGIVWNAVSPVTVAVSPAPDGAAVVLGGRF
ncbi:MAG: hypothetical protein JNJ54_16700 [Myxococcaceae bacterium]|nr:hypothetical protein [Myxococcaceae bacterium]